MMMFNVRFSLDGVDFDEDHLMHFVPFKGLIITDKNEDYFIVDKVVYDMCSRNVYCEVSLY